MRAGTTGGSAAPSGTGCSTVTAGGPAARRSPVLPPPHPPAPRRERRAEPFPPSRIVGVLEQHLAVADDQVERGAELVAQLGHRFRRGESAHSARGSRALILPSRRSSSTGLVS